MIVFMSTILTIHTLDYQNILKESLPFFTLAGDSVLAFLCVCLILVWGPLNPSLSSLYASMQGAMYSMEKNSLIGASQNSMSSGLQTRASVNRLPNTLD